MRDQDTKKAAFFYSVNLLRMLLDMGLLTQAEFDKTIDISAAHYGAEKSCV